MSGQDPDFYIKQGDVLPAIVATLTDAAGLAVDLSGTSVRFLMRPAPGITPLIAAAASVTDAPNGKVRYDWAAGDTARAGLYLAEWEVTFGPGVEETFPNDGWTQILIRRNLEDSEEP